MESGETLEEQRVVEDGVGMWGRTWECRATKGGCREEGRRSGRGHQRWAGLKGHRGRHKRSGACNSETWRNRRGPEPLEPWEQSRNLPGGGAPQLPAKPRPLPRGEAEGLEHQQSPWRHLEPAPVTPGNQTTAKKMSFGGRGSPSTRFWGRASHKFGVSARPPGIPKVGAL